MNDRDQRIVDQVPTIKQPSCPRCRYEPLEFACNVVRTVAGHMVAVIWCGHCGHTLATQFIGVEPQQKSSLIV